MGFLPHIKTIAVVPGSYKPPHAGHYDMIKYYSERADMVNVLISNPKPGSKSARKINDKEIDAQVVRQLLQLYTENLDNVGVYISGHPSPVRAAYELIERYQDKHVILGSSVKDGDDVRWAKIEEYMAEKNPSITVEVDPVEPSCVEQGVMMHASGLRMILENKQDEKLGYFIPSHVDMKKALKLLRKMR